MSDMTFNQAAEEVRKILRGFKAVEQVSEALSRVGSLENAGKEAEARLEDLRAQTVEAVTQLNAALDDVRHAKDEAKGIKADAKAKGDVLIQKAQDKADEILAAAELLRSDAEAKAAEAEAKAQSVALDVEFKRKEIAALDAKLAELKAQAARLLGG